MPPRYMVLIFMLVLTSSCGSAAEAETDAEADEEALRRAGLPVDETSLLALFRKRTPDAESQARIQALIVQLGSASFSEREEASEELASFSVAAAGLLRKATQHDDLEIRRRARDALTLIEQNDLSADVLIAALRRLSRRKPPQLVQVLLDYAPHAADSDILDQICLTLSSAALREGGVDPQLRKTLSDPSPIRRALAGAALCRCGCCIQFSAVHGLLRDPEPQVRRRVAQALLEARDKSAVPVLIDLLVNLPRDDAEHIETMLLQLAGDNAPKGSLEARGEYRDAWAEWWKKYGDRVDLAKVELSPKWRGYFLAICMTAMRGRGFRSDGSILELDAQGRKRWQMKGLSCPVDAQVLDEKRVLVTEYTTGQVTERNHEGEVLNRINVPERALEARRLSNGNTLITTASRVFELDRNGKEIWTTSGHGLSAIVSACLLRGREIGICYRSGEFVRMDCKGKVLASFRVGRLFRPYGTHIEGLPNGHILVPLYFDNKVVEFDKSGQIVWSALYPRPICAQRLPNGRTLVASYGSTGFAELDKNGREVKIQSCDSPLTSVRGR